MRKVLVLVVILATALVASANLLLNPGVEVGPAGGGTPDSWWKYSEAGQESWAQRTGTNGMAFWSWSNGVEGGFGQNVSTNLVSTDILTFSIYGLAEAQFESSDSDVWIGIELWTNGSSAYTRLDTLNVYSGLTGDRDNWNQYTIITTVGLENVSEAHVHVKFTGGTNVGGSQAVKWDDADFTVTNAIPEPTIAGLLGFAGLLICALRRKNRK